MTLSNRLGSRTGPTGGGRTAVALAIALLLVVVALSGVLAPAGPGDASFPMIGSGGEPPDADDAGSTAVAAEGPDQDGDGLADDVEVELGTDPTVADTDGDGYPDGMEVACEDRLPGADPLRQDVYVEVDSVEGASLSHATVDQLESTFTAAPIENPDGETGIAVHFVESDDDLPEDGPVNNRQTGGDGTDLPTYRSEHFDRGELGYHYLLVASDAAYNGDPSYAGAGHRGNAVVEHYERDGVMTSLIMHELGHAFGITHGNDGVDDERYSLEEYESVMNYNGIYEVTTYSDGSDDVGRDEWSYVAQNRYKPALDCPDGDCLALCSAES